MRLQNASGKLLTVILGALVWAASLSGRPALAQAQSDKQVVEDTYQRSADHYTFGYLDMKTGQSWEPEIGPELVIPARGGFDPQNNAWFGGRGGMLIKHDAKTHRIQLYHPPTSPFETFYEAMPDKNGEVWAGGLHSGRFWRFSPKNQTWTGYMMPEPYAHDRRTWIDNSTDPVTVWFVDQQGYMVRIQPLA